MSSITLVRPGIERVVDQAPDARERPLFPPAVSAALGWTAAALAVFAVERGAHGALKSLGAGGIALIEISLIVAAGAVYAWAVRGAAASFVVATGLAWLTLSIVADVVMGSESVDVGYRLLGDPTVVPEVLRDLIIVSWLAAPALFARGGAVTERREDFGRHS